MTAGFATLKGAIGGGGYLVRWGAQLAVVLVLSVAAACAAEGKSAAGNGGQGGSSSLPAISFTTASGASVPLAVEVADDPAEMTCGLMHRTDLPGGQGMIFAYQQDTLGGFWMRNSLIPLSIAYVDANGRIVDILDMAPVPASGYTPYRVPAGAVVAVREGTLPPAEAEPELRLKAYRLPSGTVQFIADGAALPPGAVPESGVALYRLKEGGPVPIRDGDPVPAGAVWVTYPPRGAYRWAIEVNRGWYQQHGIAVGDAVEASEALANADASAPPPICAERGT